MSADAFHTPPTRRSQRRSPDLNLWSSLAAPAFSHTGNLRDTNLQILSQLLKAFTVWRPKLGKCIFNTTRAARSHLSFELPQKVVSSDEPRTTREELYREAPPSLPSASKSNLPAAAKVFLNLVSVQNYRGFGCAASASRNAFTLFLSTMAVPVSTKVGIGGAGAVRQSLKSCTAL